MNSITEAMKKAGISVPLNRRIWLWLKDHPGKTSKEIALGLNSKLGNVSPTLTNLYRRGMVTMTKETLTHRSNAKGRKVISTYRAVGDKFELLPVKKTVKVNGPKITVATPKPKPVIKKKFSIDDLSVYEAKELYEQLKTIFA